MSSPIRRQKLNSRPSHRRSPPFCSQKMLMSADFLGSSDSQVATPKTLKMSKNSRRCAVFAVQRNDRGCVELYGLDEMYSPMDQRTEPVYRKYQVILVHPSWVPNPVSIFDHCHRRAGYVSSGSRFYRAGGDICRFPDCDKKVHSSKYHLSRKVDCWDAIKGEYFKLAEMNDERVYPCLLFLKGTLFVVGPCPDIPYDYENPDLVEYYIEEENTWYTTENAPPNSVNVVNFVCGAMEEEGWLLIGSGAPRSAPAGSRGVFMILKPTYNNTGKITCCHWSRASFSYNDMLDSCRGSPAAVVDGSKMMWLDGNGTKIIGFDYKSDGGAYFCIDLANEKVLPNPKCFYNRPRLVLLGDGGLMGLVWNEKTQYFSKEDGVDDRGEEVIVISEHDDYKAFNGKQSLGGFWFTTFKLHPPKLTVISHKKCFGPPPPHGDTLVSACVLDVAVPSGSRSGIKRKRERGM